MRDAGVRMYRRDMDERGGHVVVIVVFVLLVMAAGVVVALSLAP